MGYYAHSCDEDFLILKERQEHLENAIRSHFADNQYVQKARDIRDLFGEFGLTVEINDHGDIDCMYFEYDKFRSDDLEEFFSVIATFVELGSYIAFRGEEDSMWAYYFDGLSWEEFWVEVTYPGMSMTGPKKPDR